MKRFRKSISILLTLAMLVGLLLPAGSAFAYTKNTLSTVPTVGTDFAGLLGTLSIKEDGATKDDFQAGKSFIVTLPDNVSFATYENNRWVEVKDADTPVVNAKMPAGDPKNPSAAWVVDGDSVVQNAEFSTDKSLVITFEDTMPTKLEKSLKLNLYVKVDGAAGDLKLTIDGMNSGVTAGDVTVGRAASGAIEGTVLSTKNVGQENGVTLGTIRLTETTPGAVKQGDEIKLKLPTGFEWVSGSVVKGMAGFKDSDFDVAPFDGRELKITFKVTGKKGDAVSTTQGIIEITPKANIETDTKTGDIEVALSGDNVNSATLVIGKCADYGVTIKAKETPELFAGRYEEELGTIVVEETINNSMPAGRKLTVELPENAKFQEMPTITVLSGTNVFTNTTASSVSNDTRKAEFSVDGKRANGKVKFELKMKKVNLASDAAGDLEVKFSGSALGQEQKVVAATVIAPITVTTVAKDVKLGMAEQAVGDIVIKEVKAGAIKDKKFDGYEGEVPTNANGVTGWTESGHQISQGSITLELPEFDGVKFSKAPKVEVTEGNLEIDTVVKKDKLITINVKSDSSQASTIKVSDLYMTADRTVPVGKVKVDVGGTAVDQTNQGKNASKSTKGFDGGTIVTAYPATLVNAAPAAGSSTFNIGSTIYTVDGAAKVMDAAPYIKNGRTYVPVRYMALALGVTEDNISFENGVVTLNKGDITLKMTVGDMNLDNNGTISTMDAAPEINNGRTMLPARFVAEGFGAQVGYSNGMVVLSY